MLGLHCEFRGEDIRQLRTISVLATDNALLPLLVIGRGQKATKDELGNMALFLRVFLGGNAVAIILHRDCSVLDRDIDALHGQPDALFRG